MALRLTGEAGAIVGRSIRESLRLATALHSRARRRGARAKLAAAARLEQVADPDARPIRKGKLRQPTEFGYVSQLAELTESTRRGARGLILPAATRIGAAAESDLLPATGADMARLGLRPRELALDGGFFPTGVAEHLPGAKRTFIAGRQSAGSRRTNRRLARYRVGCEGRISHLKRRYRLRRSRLRGHRGGPHLGRPGRPRLQPGQPGHPGHPRHLRGFLLAPHPSAAHPNGRAPPERGRSSFRAQIAFLRGK